MPLDAHEFAPFTEAQRKQLQNAPRDDFGVTKTSEKRSILKFCLLEFILSIPFWTINGLAGAGVIPNLQMLNATWSLTPMMAAVILILREDGKAGVKELFKRCYDYQRIKSKNLVSAHTPLGALHNIRTVRTCALIGNTSSSSAVYMVSTACIHWVFLWCFWRRARLDGIRP